MKSNPNPEAAQNRIIRRRGKLGMKGCINPKTERIKDPTKTTVSLPSLLKGRAINPENGTGNNITTNSKDDCTIVILNSS